MPSTYSPSLRVELITSGDQAGQWGNTTNSNFEYIFDSAIAGYQTVSVTSANQALTYNSGPVSTPALNQSIYAMLRLTTTTTAAFNVYAPPSSKQYVIWNNSGYTATIYNSTVIGNTTAAGAGVAIANGDRVTVFSDGTAFYDVKSSSITGTLPIANGGTGQITANAAFNALAPVQTSAAGRYLKSDGTNTSWDAIDISTADVTGTLSVANGGTGVTTSTGTGATVLSTSPTLVTPLLGTPASGNLANCTFPTLNQNTTTDITINTLTVGKGPNNPVGATTFGYQAGAAATASNVQQTAIGYRALATSTMTAGASLDWEGSTAVGYKALETSNPSTLSYNTAVGAGTLRALTVGGSNTVIGAGAARNQTTGNGAVAVGTFAAELVTTSGGYVAIGYRAASVATTQLGSTVAIGQDSLLAACTNSVNSAIYNRRNTAVGHNTLNGLDAQSTGVDGSNNTALGYAAGTSLQSGSNNTIIGNAAQASTTSISNEITLGNSSITTLRCQVTSITSLSDQRDKHSIEDLPVGLALINALRPRRYKWDKRDWYINEVEREDGVTDYVPVPQDGSRAQDDWNEGFVAQEAKAALQSLGASWFPLVYEINPEKLEMSSGKLIPVLVKAIQELTARLEALEAK